MKFHPLPIDGVFAVELDLLRDERGFFSRTFCEKEFQEHGLISSFRQCNLSYNVKKGILRGMHFQKEPHEEAKLIRCLSGSIYDVILDLRPHSPTFKKWTAIEISASNHKMVYIPKGCAHGFQALEDNTEVFYQMSDFYVPEAASGVRWDDPAFDIRWPIEDKTVSSKDQQYSDFTS